MITRRKFGLGIASILSTGIAPAAIVKSIVAGREQSVFGGAKLPYDAEVEYLESTGSQWIDTGVAGLSGLVINMRFMPIYPVATTYQDYMGGSNSDNLAGYRIRNNQSTENRIGIAVGGGVNQNISIAASTMVDVAISQSNVAVNGNTVIATLGTSYSGQNIYLFAFNTNGTAFRKSKMRLALFSVAGKIDLIPVRFTNELGQSEGAMYDRANPTVGMNRDGTPRTDGLYLNRGTGDFVIGPDK